MTDNKHKRDQPDSDRPELDDPLKTGIESDAVIEAEAETAAAASDTFEQAADELPASDFASLKDSEEDPQPAPPAKLERLQKILAQSGIASRRHAEELITAGRVQVNGKVIIELGSKADSARDHIRVDGKLLQGTERHRYFMLNKPKGYVTTVSDPEGRPTIMEFFSKTRERLYPVGRLDYLSEGLLLVTNDGELANKLTRAASGVEKTYLVKVSGQPSEADLDRLREGVPIDKEKPGSSRVHTAPAEIRPFRPGKPSGKRGPSRPVDNPWYEVVLIEGRNRELRKMFEEIGHHVEKIRRVGYGPLVLDLEPGKTRELEPEEIENLRKTAEGKYRKPKPREPRKREFPQRSERPTSKPRWNERRPDSRKAGDSVGRPERPFRRDQPGFVQSPDSNQTRRPGRDQFRAGPRREFRPTDRPNPRSQEDRSQRPPLSENRDRPYGGGPRENRGRFASDQPRGRSPKPAPQSTWSDKPERTSRPPRFEREAGAGRPPQRPGQFQRRDRGSFDRPSGSFSGKRTDSPRPQRFAEKHPSDSDHFPVKKRLEIRPADENFDGQTTGAPERPNRRSFEQRPGARPFRPQRQDKPQGKRPDPKSFDRPKSEGRSPRTPDRRLPGPNRDRQVGSDRPRRESSGRERTENRPKRGFDQRSSGSRPSGSFNPGKRGPSGRKQGTTRPAGNRRPNSRPGGGNRPGKRRP